uniref:uncharacterized protein LOC109970698 n=1 Tax=Monopterus albus TaxID=43700 RepID=UPI0009B373A8|nr:uncharacterized protein LOC109970698 [Monopterus albus]
MFKSEEPGIKTELWQLNTHPVLLQGASLQVTLKGVALYEDNTADQRRFIEMKLEKTAIVKTCLSVVYEVLRGVHTPERPSSPAELYITEEQVFVRKNPKLQYIDEPVEALKTLWQEVNPGCTWDLSVDTLRQVVLSLPEHESTQGTLTREQSLNQLNSLLLQLSAPSELKRYHLTAAIIGQQLWVILLDTMAGEAMRLRNLLGVPEKKAWTENKDKSQLPDADLADDIIKDEKSDKKRGSSANEENGGAKSRLKDDNRGESKSPTTEKSVEESKKKGKKRDELGKGKTRGRPGKESVPLTEAYLVSTSTVSGQQPLDQNVKPEVMNIYTRLLHRKVYVLMEDLVDSLCDLMDERDEQDPHCHHTKETGAPLDMWLDVIKHVS